MKKHLKKLISAAVGLGIFVVFIFAPIIPQRSTLEVFAETGNSMAASQRYTSFKEIVIDTYCTFTCFRADPTHNNFNIPALVIAFVLYLEVGFLSSKLVRKFM